MDKSRIIELMARKTGSCATPEELEELAGLLSVCPDFAYLSEIVQSLKGNQDHIETSLPGKELVTQGWAHLMARSKAQTDEKPESLPLTPTLSGQKFRFHLRRLIAAAVLTGFIACAWLYFQHRPVQPRSADKMIFVNYGQTSKITLPDGSIVRLNAGSRLVYPEHFSDIRREVTLEGEAFFDVIHNPRLPFMVHAGKIIVRVLGTRFNVKAYKDDANIETTLISGKVQVTLNDDPDKKIDLSPHEKLTVFKTPLPDKVKPGHPVEINKLRYQVQQLPEMINNSFMETAWTSNKLALSNESFEQVARLLERKYNVMIYFDRDALKQEHFSGVFQQETIGQVLGILKMTTKFNYRISGNVIHIY